MDKEYILLLLIILYMSWCFGQPWIARMEAQKRTHVAPTTESPLKNKFHSYFNI